MLLPDILALICHPETPAPAVHAMEVHVAPGREGHLTLAYRLIGDLAGLCIPPPQRPAFADGLWEHTCFEVFIAAATSPAYREFNFSPSGQWATYAFSGYRKRDEAAGRSASAVSPQIAVRQLADRLELDATIAPDSLPANPGRAALQLALSSVVEAADGSRSYWALRHTMPRPDFHRRDAFALQLADPRITLS
jgi:hypothetical protein